MYDRILVPIDLEHEEAASRILARAARLAGTHGRVVALHVVPEIPTYIETYVPQEVSETQAKALGDKMREMAAAAGLTNAEFRVETGVAHIRILEFVEEQKPDLVIIGSHKPGLSDYFLGSTAARVVRHAPCSVLVDR